MEKTKVVNLNKDKYDVYIGRGSKWGNPYTSIKDRKTLAKFVVDTREESIEKYWEHVLGSPELMESHKELEGKTLGCFCKPKSCHGDILVELIESKRFYTLF